MQHRERAEHDDGQPGGEREVAVAHAEHVAEQQLLQARRRVGREREQHAERRTAP